MGGKLDERAQERVENRPRITRNPCAVPDRAFTPELCSPQSGAGRGAAGESACSGRVNQ